MSSEKHGAVTSDSEITNIGTTGFWLLVDGREYFVPYKDYPGFRDATVAQIFAVRRLGPTQLSWAALDIDVELEALEHPEQFPLQFQ
ncbi:MAG: DUF2442 domain-containing protein [Acidobacteria bacterium]|nr:DUF2442 domain-containing protein [Acidobacteriota bacterium]